MRQGVKLLFRHRDGALVGMQVLRIQDNQPAVRKKLAHRASGGLKGIVITENDGRRVGVLRQKGRKTADCACFHKDVSYGNGMRVSARTRFGKLAHIDFHNAHSSSKTFELRENEITAVSFLLLIITYYSRSV